MKVDRSGRADVKIKPNIDRNTRMFIPTMVLTHNGRRIKYQPKIRQQFLHAVNAEEFTKSVIHQVSEHLEREIDVQDLVDYIEQTQTWKPVEVK